MEGLFVSGSLDREANLCDMTVKGNLVSETDQHEGSVMWQPDGKTGGIDQCAVSVTG